MEFWIIWIVGVVLTLFTAYIMRMDTKIPTWVFYILVSICVIIVGGIADAKFFGMLFSDSVYIPLTWFDIVMLIFCIVIPLVLTYAVGYVIVGIDYFEEKWANKYFIVLFIVSVISWTIPIVHYNNNIEYIDQTVVLQTEERQLFYFCNIPVQNVSGHISGSSFLGNGSINGTISTTDVLSYWYKGKDEEALYDSAQAQNSSIIFIDDSESPYVEIIHYRNQKVTVNHNNGKESTEITGGWDQYNFYLPETIMQYNLE